MAVNINPAGGYFRLDSWILANIIQLGTQSFCERFVSYDIDPGRRMFDQMIMAARSVPANIAEGASRHDTSIETEMRLTDVARASLSELKGDYFNFLLKIASKHRGLEASSRIEAPKPRSFESQPRSFESQPRSFESQPRGIAASKPAIWSVNDQMYKAMSAIRLDRPNYSDDLMLDVATHILNQKAKFDPWIESDDMCVAANAMMLLCFRLIYILTHQLQKQLDLFKQTGGFTENMTDTRLQAKREQNQQQGVPNCPICGAVMVKVMAKKGVRAGQEFWSCSNWRTSGCQGTRPV